MRAGHGWPPRRRRSDTDLSRTPLAVAVGVDGSNFNAVGGFAVIGTRCRVGIRHACTLRADRRAVVQVRVATGSLRESDSGSEAIGLPVDSGS